jgi:hypothetical protein
VTCRGADMADGGKVLAVSQLAESNGCLLVPAPKRSFALWGDSCATRSCPMPK